MSKPLRVLIVEDSLVDTELELVELRLGGYDPDYKRVDTPEQMKAALVEREWDIILSDYVMPRFSGPAALRLSQRMGLDVPFIMVTGQVGEETAVESMKAGANDYVLKGNLTRLVPAIHRELRDAEVRRERNRAEKERDHLLEELREARDELEMRVQERTEELEVANEELQAEIDERRRTEEALQKSEAKLRAVFRSLVEGVVFLNTQGEVEEANDAIQRLHGHTLRELADPELDPRWRIIRPDGTPFPVDEQPAIVALRTGEAVRDVEMGVPTREGRLRWRMVNAQPVYDDHGNLLGVVASFFDITELHNLQDETQRRAAELRAILDNMVEGVFVSDAEGRITLVNETGTKVLGMDGSEEVKRALAEFPELLRVRHPDGRPVSPEEQPMVRALAGEIVAQDDLIIFNRKTRQDAYLRISAAPIKDEPGRIAGAVAVVRDVTELTELDRLKEQFIAVAAHELKTPVTSVKGFAQVLLRREYESISPTGLKALAAINRQADRIGRLVDDLLDISQLQTGQLELTIERIDLPEFLQEVIDRMTLTTAKHPIQLVKAEPVVVQADRGRLEEVMTNLLDNAIRYSPMGGEIDVALAVSGPEVLVSVKDHGVGIPRDKQSRIFQRFYRAHTGTPYDYGGMGVGLYISKEIIGRHGGRLWFESKEGQGSTFSFSIPLKVKGSLVSI